MQTINIYTKNDIEKVVDNKIRREMIMLMKEINELRAKIFELREENLALNKKIDMRWVNLK